MKVAAVQLVSSDNLESNLQRASEFVAQARSKQADVVVFPETFLTFGIKKPLTLDEQSSIVESLGELARQHRIWLVAGTLPLNLSGLFGECGAGDCKPYASMIIFDDRGNIRGKYSKIHLFDVDVGDNIKAYRESDRYAFGDQVTVVESPWGNLGCAVCYDLRFPELFMRLMELGSALIVVPSAFTEKTGEAHWEILVRARAIETQCFVVAANQGGTHFNSQRTWGHSMIVNPWGEILSKADKGEALIVADLSMQMLHDVRRKMPIRQHRRLDKR